jgi:hypothetical protein
VLNLRGQIAAAPATGVAGVVAVDLVVAKKIDTVLVSTVVA